MIDSENLSSTDILLDIKKEYFIETGLKTTSLIRIDKLATIDKRIILGELGIINDDLLKIVHLNLKEVLDLK